MIEKEELDRFIASCRDEQAELLMTLGRIPAPSHHEEKRAAFCKKWFEHEGCNEVWIDEAQNVICKFNCDRYDEITVMMAHMDVVFNDTEELPMRRDGDILRAPGIGDDTANLVNLMLATRFLVQHKDRLHTGLMIVANSCEEGLGNLKGCKEIFNNYGDRIRRFYSFDGYMSQCTSIAVGSHRYRMQVQCPGGTPIWTSAKTMRFRSLPRSFTSCTGSPRRSRNTPPTMWAALRVAAQSIPLHRKLPCCTSTALPVKRACRS